MSDLATSTLAGLYITCWALSIVSALVPWINGELLLLTAVALVDAPSEIGTLVVLASSGQMLGKGVLYWSARGAIPRRSRRISAVVERWQNRMEGSALKQWSLVLISSALGIPPFYLISLLAGALKVDFGPFLAVGMAGRLVRFGLIATVPQIASQYLNR